jgi:hypothetical protein
VAAVGDGIAAVALPLVAVASSNGDPLWVASVVAAQHLPWVLVQLTGAARSFDRRSLVGLADTARALALGALALLTVRNNETMLVVDTAAFLVGLGEAWTDRLEAEAGATPSVAPRGMLAIGLVGFPLGGFLYDLVSGPATPLFVDVLVFSIASTLALAISGPVRGPAPAATTPDAGGEPATGTKASRPHPAALPLLAAAAAASFAASGVLGLLVLFATVDLGLGAPAFGILLAGLAASTAVGGFTAPSVGERVGVRTGVALGFALAGAALAVGALAADVNQPWQAAVALGVSSGSAMAAMVLVRARLRVLVGARAAPGALDQLHLAIWGAIPIGALAAGWAARGLPVHRVLVALGLVWMASAAAVLAVDRSAGEPGATSVERSLREIV